jgi:hypothetical protein
MCRGSIKSGRGQRLGTGIGLWLGLVLGLVLPANAQVSQFYAFPGEYAASRPPNMMSNGPYRAGSSPYSYSPRYRSPAAGGWTAAQAPSAPPPAWAARPAPPYSGATSFPVPSSSWRPNGMGYDAGLFSRWRLYGTGYDSGLFYGRP